jgi:hypothetical protein
MLFVSQIGINAICFKKKEKKEKEIACNGGGTLEAQAR